MQTDWTPGQRTADDATGEDGDDATGERGDDATGEELSLIHI